jgi:hypothetical protein
VDDVVPAVDVEDSDHRVDLAGIAEVRRIEEAGDSGGHEDDPEDEGVDLRRRSFRHGAGSLTG